MEIWVCTCFMIIWTSRGKNNFSLTMTTWNPWIVKEGERLELKYMRKWKGGEICVLYIHEKHPPVSCMIYLWIEQCVHYLRGKTLSDSNFCNFPLWKGKRDVKRKMGLKRVRKRCPFLFTHLSMHKNIFDPPVLLPKDFKKKTNWAEKEITLTS